MSTYTDLQNRVKESLAVDYRTRITTQKISAMNEENLFVGTFRGRFSGGAMYGVSCVDCTMLSGTAERQLMVEPFLSVGFDEQAQEPVVSSLTAYIAEHGSGVAQIVAGKNVSVSPESGTGIVTISASGGTDISVDEEILSTSTNPVQNKAVYAAFEYVRDYITNVLGTRITDLINQKFQTLQQLVAQYPAQEQEVGRSAIVYDAAGNAKFYTVAEEGGVNVWTEVPTVKSMYVSKTTDVDKMAEAQTGFSAGISPVDGTKLEQLLSDYTELNDHVPTSRLVKATAEQLSSMIVEGSQGAAEWIKDHFDADQISDVYARNSVSVCQDLSVGFDRVLDSADHQLSDLLRDLGDDVAVLAVCMRVNEIRTLAGLEDLFEPIDYTVDRVEDLFDAVKLIGPSRPGVESFAEAVESLNLALGELSSAQTGVSLETRLRTLDDSVYGVAEYVDSEMSKTSGQISYLSSQISSISPATEYRLSAVEGRVSAIEGDYLKASDKTSLQSQISLKANSADVAVEISSASKAVCGAVYGALSSLPADPQVLDIDTVSRILFDLRAVLSTLR